MSSNSAETPAQKEIERQRVHEILMELYQLAGANGRVAAGIVGYIGAGTRLVVLEGALKYAHELETEYPTKSSAKSDTL